MGKYSLLPDCSKRKNGWEKGRVFYLDCLYWGSGFYVNLVPHNSKRFSRSSSLIITWNLLIETEIWPHTNNLEGDSREKNLKKNSQYKIQSIKLLKAQFQTILPHINPETNPLPHYQCFLQVSGTVSWNKLTVSICCNIE